MSTILEEMNQLPALPLLPFHREQKTFLEGLVEILGSRVGVGLRLSSRFWLRYVINVLLLCRTQTCSSAPPGVLGAPSALNPYKSTLLSREAAARRMDLCCRRGGFPADSILQGPLLNRRRRAGLTSHLYHSFRRPLISVYVIKRNLEG